MLKRFFHNLKVKREIQQLVNTRVVDYYWYSIAEAYYSDALNKVEKYSNLVKVDPSSLNKQEYKFWKVKLKHFRTVRRWLKRQDDEYYAKLKSLEESLI